MKRVKKHVADSSLFNQQRRVRYKNLNSLGTMHGGDIYSIMDELAAIVAERHSENTAVTRWDEGGFIKPVLPSDILIFFAYLNRTWGSSMDIGVQVYKEKQSIIWRRVSLELVGIREYVFVALDSTGQPTKVPRLIPKTKAERCRYLLAGRRRKLRLQIAKLQDPPTLKPKNR